MNVRHIVYACQNNSLSALRTWPTIINTIVQLMLIVLPVRMVGTAVLCKKRTGETGDHELTACGKSDDNPAQETCATANWATAATMLIAACCLITDTSGACKLPVETPQTRTALMITSSKPRCTRQRNHHLRGLAPSQLCIARSLRRQLAWKDPADPCMHIHITESH